MLVAALKSRYFRHRCYRCFLHSVSSVTINEVTDQSGAAATSSSWRRPLLGARKCVVVRRPISFVGIGDNTGAWIALSNVYVIKTSNCYRFTFLIYIGMFVKRFVPSRTLYVGDSLNYDRYILYKIIKES